MESHTSWVILADTLFHVQNFAFDLQKGDVVVVATDGVTDNVFPEEAAAIISVIQRKGETPQVAATGLANYASMRCAFPNILDYCTRFCSGFKHALVLPVRLGKMPIASISNQCVHHSGCTISGLPGRSNVAAA